MCVAPTMITRGGGRHARAGTSRRRRRAALRPRRKASAIEDRWPSLHRRSRAFAIGETRRDDDRRRSATAVSNFLQEGEIGLGIERATWTRILPPHARPARQAVSSAMPKLKVSGLPGLDDVEGGGDDVGFDAAAGNGPLKLVDAGNRQLPAGADGRRAPGIDDGRHGDRPAGLEPSAGGGAGLGYRRFGFGFTFDGRSSVTGRSSMRLLHCRDCASRAPRLEARRWQNPRSR